MGSCKPLYFGFALDWDECYNLVKTEIEMTNHSAFEWPQTSRKILGEVNDYTRTRTSGLCSYCDM